jgi:cytochrome c oxidase subunit II
MSSGTVCVDPFRILESAQLEQSMNGKWAKRVIAAAAWAPALVSANDYNLQAPQTIIAREIYDLHTLILVICCVIFVLVFGAMFYAIVVHRKSVGHKAEQFHENTTVEIAWTIVPFLILIGMAIPATKTIIAMKDTSNPDMTIKVTGYQWKWNYDYLQEGISFYSNLSTPREDIEDNSDAGRKRREANPNYLLEVDNPVVVPVGKKIRLIITANDVIHAWWVPALGVKQDAIPGFVRDTWFRADKPGTYRGQCAELCGKEHAFMPVVVEVVEPEKYAAWAAEQKQKMAAQADDPNKTWTPDELRARGEKVYAANCQVCHQANGMGQPPAFPALAGSKLTTGAKNDHINIVLHGKPGTAMAPFKQLSDVEIAAVVTYERNSWGNKTGDAISPAEVKQLRK